ncbi:MAG: type 1 glutamine amidotransferase [Pseudomonadota bacterium]
MKLLVFQHLACEHPAIFRDFLKEDGIDWQTVELDEGDAIPDLEPYDVLWVMGGPQDVWQVEEHPWLLPEMAAIRQWVQDLNRPFLGFCLGHQLLAQALGGQVGPAKTPEVGMMSVDLTEAGQAHPLFAGLASPQPCLQWHGAEVLTAPPDAVVLASSPACPVNAFAVGERAFGLQYHSEINGQTVPDWGSIPAYAASLESALGPGALGQLERDAAAALPGLNQAARQLYQNFMGIAGY